MRKQKNKKSLLRLIQQVKKEDSKCIKKYTEINGIMVPKEYCE